MLKLIFILTQTKSIAHAVVLKQLFVNTIGVDSCWIF